MLLCPHSSSCQSLKHGRSGFICQSRCRFYGGSVCFLFNLKFVQFKVFFHWGCCIQLLIFQCHGGGGGGRAMMLENCLLGLNYEFRENQLLTLLTVFSWSRSRFSNWSVLFSYNTPPAIFDIYAPG